MDEHFPEPDHHHDNCVERARSTVLKKVEKDGRKFGANQLNVLDALLQDHDAASAYDLVERIAKDGKKLQPVQVYRALEGLIEMGLVHRVQSRNGFVVCSNLGNCENPRFLLCSSCQRVAEIASEAVSNVISKTVKQANFLLQKEMVELTGLCHVCADLAQKNE